MRRGFLRIPKPGPRLPGAAGPGLRDRPSPAAIAPARAPHSGSVPPPPAPPSPRGTRGFSRVLRRNLSANPSSGKVGSGLGSSGGGGPAAMAKVTARPFPAAVAPPPKQCMPGVAVRRACLPRGAAVSELHFPWCPGTARQPRGQLARVRHAEGQGEEPAAQILLQPQPQAALPQRTPPRRAPHRLVSAADAGDRRGLGQGGREPLHVSVGWGTRTAAG